MEQKSTDRVALIDFDPVYYIVGHKFRDADPNNPSDVIDVQRSVDSIIDLIMTMTHSTHYILAISQEITYRHAIYHYAKYKGDRGDKPDFIKKWKPYILKHASSKWGIVEKHNMEADDIIAGTALKLKFDGIEYVVCSPDKDLKQIPGMHFNFTKGEQMEITEITKEEANYNLWLQVLTGDSTDNIAGVPGMGPVKAAALLKTVSPMEYSFTIQQAYYKYFGEYYGEKIFFETRYCIKLETSGTAAEKLNTYTPAHERAIENVTW